MRTSFALVLASGLAVAAEACGSTSRSTSPLPVASTVASVPAAASASAVASASASAAQVASAIQCSWEAYGDAGGFFAGHPFWSLGETTNTRPLVFGEVDAASHAIAIRGSVVASRYQLATVPGRPRVVLAPTATDTRILFGDQGDPDALADTGMVYPSKDGKLFAVRSYDAIALYEVAGFRRRFSAPLHTSTGAVIMNDRHLISLGGDAGAIGVFDVKTGAPVYTGFSPFSAASPSGAVLALAQTTEEPKWVIDLVHVGAVPTTRRVSLSIAPYLPLELRFPTESLVEVDELESAAMMQPGTSTNVARVDVATGTARAGDHIRHSNDDWMTDAVARLESAARGLLPLERTFVGRSGWDLTFAGPTASGFVAAVTVLRDATAAGAAELFVADTKKHAVLRTSRLPTGLAPRAVWLTADERFVVLAGDGGTFVLDVTTGRTSFVTDLTATSSSGSPIQGTWVWTTLGLRDLTSDEADPTWPALLPAPDPQPICDALRREAAARADDPASPSGQ